MGFLTMETMLSWVPFLCAFFLSVKNVTLRISEFPSSQLLKRCCDSSIPALQFGLGVEGFPTVTGGNTNCSCVISHAQIVIQLVSGEGGGASAGLQDLTVLAVLTLLESVLQTGAALTTMPLFSGIPPSVFQKLLTWIWAALWDQSHDLPDSPGLRKTCLFIIAHHIMFEISVVSRFFFWLQSPSLQPSIPPLFETVTGQSLLPTQGWSGRSYRFLTLLTQWNWGLEIFRNSTQSFQPLSIEEKQTKK